MPSSTALKQLQCSWGFVVNCRLAGPAPLAGVRVILGPRLGDSAKTCFRIVGVAEAWVDRGGLIGQIL
jgi:hypothetical protein